MNKAKVNKNTTYLILIVSAFILLLLSMVNIKTISTNKEVLGIKTQTESDEEFWNNFLVNNPNYIPGWIEIGKFEKAASINPNFEGLDR